MGVDEGNLQVIDIDRRDTGKLSNNYSVVRPPYSLRYVEVLHHYNEEFERGLEPLYIEPKV